MDTYQVISDETYLSEKHLAKRWGVSVKKLQADRYKGVGIPYVCIGKLRRYRLSDVLAYEQANLCMPYEGGQK